MSSTSFIYEVDNGIAKIRLNDPALELEAAAQARCMRTADFKEVFNAFVEKRAPIFNSS